MILSVSRRTDIPACYPDWLCNRLREGFVLVRNPMNPRRVSRIAITPDTVEGIVLWSKNPLPMLDRLDALAPYPYYFQITITPYGTDIEPGVPNKGREILPAFVRLSDAIGPARVIWRYDPVLLSPRYSEAYHLDCFARLAKRLHPYTNRCIFSFVDDYRNTRKNAQAMALASVPPQAMRRLAKGFAQIAQAYGLALFACAEEMDLSGEGIMPASCIDAGLLAQIAGRPVAAPRDKNQRKLCHCAAAVDIGAYNTCQNGCLYCYANYSETAIPRNAAQHDPASPLLVGHVGPEDVVYDRK